MMTVGSLPAFSISLAAVAVMAGIGAAAAQPMPDAGNGRYTLSPVADGVIRLDTQDRSGLDLQQQRQWLGLLCRARRTRGVRCGNRPAAGRQ